MSNEELTKEQLFIKPYLLGYYRSFVGLELEYLRDFYKAEEKKEHISLAEYESYVMNVLEKVFRENFLKDAANNNQWATF
ncbi:18459_t:CDS:2 [Rhizophagus irregularis]|nr:18459_t:CDS:2 [Rhizophagus irregularis]